MQIFVDETFDQDGYHWLSAVLVRDSEVAPATACFERIAEAAAAVVPSVNPATELHAYPLLNQQGDWSAASVEQSLAVMRCALRCLDRHRARFLYLGLDPDRLAANGWAGDPDSARAATMKRLFGSKPADAQRVLFIRLAAYLATALPQWGESGVIIADQHPLQQTVANDLARYAGLYGQSAAIPISFANSVDSRLIQAADLAAYVHQRRWRDTSPQHPRALAAIEALAAHVDHRLLRAEFVTY